VPYHQLPRLHALVKDDCPAPYPSLTMAYREMIPAILRQMREPGWYIRRTLPPTARPVGTRPTAVAIATGGRPVVDGWVDVCAATALATEDVIRVDHAHHTYAIHRTAQGTVHATDGMCTHGNTHLADGMVRGAIVECPKHNGRFDVITGKPTRLPSCVALRTHRVREDGGRILLDVSRVAVSDLAGPVYTLQVVSNRNVATFIKELVLAPTCDRPSHVGEWPACLPGQYMQLHVPAYGIVRFDEFVVDEPYASVWRAHHLFDLAAANDLEVKRNYSLATNPASTARELRFNVRIATPPPVSSVMPGRGHPGSGA
jgi:Na+-transporting NADH:ubiquinone oxidoreductase subunit F